VIVHQGPSLTQERYEETVRRVSGGKRRMESPEDWPVEGLLARSYPAAEELSGLCACVWGGVAVFGVSAYVGTNATLWSVR